MITKAYRALMSLMNQQTVSNTFPAKTFKDTSGTNRTTPTNGQVNGVNKPNGTVYNGVYSANISTAGDLSIGIFVGSGNTPATADDYVLESPLNSTYLSRTSTTPDSSAILDENGNIIGVRRAVTYQNITQSDVTVNEIGTYFYCRYTTGSSGSTSTFLIERTVLDTPVVLAPNDTITVAFDLTY